MVSHYNDSGVSSSCFYIVLCYDYFIFVFLFVRILMGHHSCSWCYL